MNYFHLYSSFLKKFYSPNPDKKLRVVFDCLNNPTSIILKHLFKKEIQEKRFELINTDLKKSRADLGVIFDFDGDRAFFIDNKSRSIQPEAIARLLIWQLKPKRVIIDVTTGWLVRKFRISNFEFRISKSRVGHYFIKQKMRAENADFGAEHSGHYYFKEFFGLDSGILAAIEAINAVSRLPYKLSDFIDLLPRYYSKEININIKKFNLPEIKQSQEVELQKILKKLETHYKLYAKSSKLKTKVSHLDGLTMEFSSPAGEWWFNLRFSQTEPLLRLNVEAKEKSKLQEEVFKLKKLL